MLVYKHVIIILFITVVISKVTCFLERSWSAGTGPVKDLYTMASNPQFFLDVGPNASGAVWILLTRHITEIEDFRENREFITVLVYKTNGRRVYYPNDPPPYIDGVRINSPHYLCKIILSSESSGKYTLVMSQYEKSQTINYTLRAYATCPFTLNKIKDPYIYTKEISDEWKGVTAGGCGNHPSTYKNNPRFSVTVDGSPSNNQVFVELKGSKDYQIGFDITISSVACPDVTAPFKTSSSGAFRSGYTILDLENIPSGVFHVVPSTFLPGLEGPFILTVKSSCSIHIVRDR